MTTSEVRHRLSPGRVAALCVAVGIALCFTPASLRRPLRDAALLALGPGLRTAQAVQGPLRGASDWLEAARQSAVERTVQRHLVHRLQRENQQLRTALAAAQLRDEDSAQDTLPRLLAVEGVRVRILGHLARQHLAQEALVDVGSRDAFLAESPVVAPAEALLDAGTRQALSPEQLVLAGARLYGKLAEVGPWTSVVRHVTAPGFRAVAQLARRDGSRLHWGARGVIEGIGQPHLRLRLVPTTEPVSVGDRVYCAELREAVPLPLLIGEVVRVTRLAGEDHWNIEVAPAVGRDVFDELVALRPRVNPQRLANSAHWE